MANELSILENFDKAKVLIAEADLPEAIDLINKAEALRVYATKAQKGQEIQNQCAELKIRAERRAGEMLAEMDKNPGTVLGGNIVKPPSDIPKLEDLGISKIQSHRWQLEANIPTEKFENHIEQIKSKPSAELTSISIIRLAKDIKRKSDLKHNQDLVNNSKPIPNEIFKTITIDPPWDWGDEGDINQFGRARPIYVTTSFEDLTKIPINNISEQNAHLYLWITNRSLPKGFRLLEAWGFRYITLLTWCKPSFGMGNYFRGQTEHIMFAIKGSLPLLRHDVGTWFGAERGDNHSSKPESFYKLVESCSPGPWLEMYATHERPGWTCWGAEVGTRNS